MAENRNEELSINDEFCPSYSLEESHLEDVERKNTPILGISLHTNFKIFF